MRIAVLSDVHANLTALEAVLTAMGSVDRIWHLGDVVGYGPDPDAVVERLAESGAVGVMGNHDAASTIDPDLIEWFNPAAAAAIRWTRRQISGSTRDWLAGLPRRRIDGDWTLVHGSVRDPLLEYVTSTDVAEASLAALGTRYALHGHTHVPIAIVEGDADLEVTEPEDGTTLELDERHVLLNPGSVGQPRDGNPEASWLEIDGDAGRVTWRRAVYDVAAVQERMRAAGLPRRLADRLSLGR